MHVCMPYLWLSSSVCKRVVTSRGGLTAGQCRVVVCVSSHLPCRPAAPETPPRDPGHRVTESLPPSDRAQQWLVLRAGTGRDNLKL